MKSLYVCEKCGRQFTDYDEAYACENSHISISNNLESQFMNPSWKPGDIMPREITLQSCDVYDESQEKYVTRYAVYTLKKMLSKEEGEAIDKARQEYYDEQQKQWEEWRKKREAKMEGGETA